MWATFVGAAVAGLSLVAAGIVHGSLIADGASTDQINGTLTWFRYAASGGLALASLGGLAALRQPVPDVHHRAPRRIRAG